MQNALNETQRNPSLRLIYRKQKKIHNNLICARKKLQTQFDRTAKSPKHYRFLPVFASLRVQYIDEYKK
jgi:hypothetical protein